MFLQPPLLLLLPPPLPSPSSTPPQHRFWMLGNDVDLTSRLQTRLGFGDGRRSWRDTQVLKYSGVVSSYWIVSTLKNYFSFAEIEIGSLINRIGPNVKANEWTICSYFFLLQYPRFVFQWDSVQWVGIFFFVAVESRGREIERENLTKSWNVSDDRTTIMRIPVAFIQHIPPPPPHSRFPPFSLSTLFILRKSGPIHHHKFFFYFYVLDVSVRFSSVRRLRLYEVVQFEVSFPALSVSSLPRPHSPVSFAILLRTQWQHFEKENRKKRNQNDKLNDND